MATTTERVIKIRTFPDDLRLEVAGLKWLLKRFPCDDEQVSIAVFSDGKLLSVTLLEYTCWVYQWEDFAALADGESIDGGSYELPNAVIREVAHKLAIKQHEGHDIDTWFVDAVAEN